MLSFHHNSIIVLTYGYVTAVNTRINRIHECALRIVFNDMIMFRLLMNLLIDPDL